MMMISWKDFKKINAAKMNNEKKKWKRNRDKCNILIIL